MKQRYFKVTNNFYAGIIEGVYPLYEERNGGYAIKVNTSYGGRTQELFFRPDIVKEVFNYNPISDKAETVANQVFSNKTHLDNYDLFVNNKPIDEFLDSKGERWMEETEGLVGKRVFSTGATRNTDDGKLDFEGFLSPLVLKRYAEYMHNHRKLEDGSLRDSDNWQRGIPKDQYIKSLWRHFFDTWSNHRGLETKEDQQMNLCGVIFNSMGMLHELMKEDNEKATGII